MKEILGLVILLVMRSGVGLLRAEVETPEGLPPSEWSSTGGDSRCVPATAGGRGAWTYDRWKGSGGRIAPW